MQQAAPQRHLSPWQRERGREQEGRGGCMAPKSTAAQPFMPRTQLQPQSKGDRTTNPCRHPVLTEDFNLSLSPPPSLPLCTRAYIFDKADRQNKGECREFEKHYQPPSTLLTSAPYTAQTLRCSIGMPP